MDHMIPSSLDDIYGPGAEDAATPSVVDVEELSDLLDSFTPDELASCEVVYYDDETYPVAVRDGSLYIEMTFTCKCGAESDMLHVGMAAPGWCYVYDPQTGEFLGDLRDQEFVCDDCDRKE